MLSPLYSINYPGPLLSIPVALHRVMASHHQLLPLYLLILLLPSALATTFLLPVIRTPNHAGPQYHTILQVGTPRVAVLLTIDVNNLYTLIACDLVSYNHSSTYTTVQCDTADCFAYSGGPPTPVCIDCNDTSVPTPYCNLNQCGSLSSNPIASVSTLGRLVRDSATFYRMTAAALAQTTVPRVPISCVDPAVLKGLSKFSYGILSLARTTTAFAFHVSAAFNIPHIFALCLPSSSTPATDGVYFGGGPYSVSKAIAYVPLLLNANSSVPRFDIADPSVQYYIKVNAIEIDGSPVEFNSSVLLFDGNGNGGTVVSTIQGYGKLRSEIFKPFVALFVAMAEAKNVKTVGLARKEFGACFDPESIQYDPKTGSGLPVIDLVLERGVKWRIFGSNSVVEVDREASCLAFVETKVRKPTPTSAPEVFPAVVIGGVQMEDNLMEFDLKNSKLGFTSSLLTIGTSCAKFNGN